MAALVLLYVDDDDAAFFLLEIAVKEIKQDVELHRAADGEQAIEFLQHSGLYRNAPRPDLILLDVNLPKKDGMELLKDLKADESLRSIPVVMFSSSSRAVDKKESLALGAQKYVTKPPNLEGFLEAVRRMVFEESRVIEQAAARGNSR